MRWLLVRWGRNEFLHPGIGKIWWNRLIGSVIAVTRYMKRNVVLIAVNLRLNGLWPGYVAAAYLQYTGRPLGESTRELSYSWKAGRANVSGSATRLPGVSGRVALWSRITFPSRSKWLQPLHPFDDSFGRAFSSYCDFHVWAIRHDYLCYVKSSVYL